MVFFWVQNMGEDYAVAIVSPEAKPGNTWFVHSRFTEMYININSNLFGKVLPHVPQFEKKTVLSKFIKY